MEALGYIFGMAGLAFAIMATEKIDKLRLEFDALKKTLEDSGIFKDNGITDDNDAPSSSAPLK